MSNPENHATPIAPPVEQMIRDLEDAGWKPWKPHARSIWESPNGKFYFGPYAAWKVMKRTADSTVFKHG